MKGTHFSKPVGRGHKTDLSAQPSRTCEMWAARGCRGHLVRCQGSPFRFSWVTVRAGSPLWQPPSHGAAEPAFRLRVWAHRRDQIGPLCPRHTGHYTVIWPLVCTQTLSQVSADPREEIEGQTHGPQILAWKNCALMCRKAGRKCLGDRHLDLAQGWLVLRRLWEASAPDVLDLGRRLCSSFPLHCSFRVLIK